MTSACIVDNREPSHICRLTFGCDPCVVAALPEGDVWITTCDGRLVKVERKTVGDLLGSIADNRLQSQVLRMCETTPYVYIVIVGELTCTHDGKVIADGRETQWPYSSVWSYLLTIQEMGAVVVFAENDDAFEPTVMRIANRDYSKVHVVAPRIDSRLVTPGEAILSALPGIGIDKAQLILNDFDNRAALALPWLTHMKTVHRVYGIGDGTKKRVRAALGVPDGHELDLVPTGGIANDN